MPSCDNCAEDGASGSAAEPIVLRLNVAHEALGRFHEEFFWGAWHPRRDLRVALDDSSKGFRFRHVGDRNWQLISSIAPDGESLVHKRSADQVHPGRRERAPTGVAFRGYLLNGGIHSASTPSRVIRYWDDEVERRHNGVFAAALVQEWDPALELVSDAFGIAPLYWRQEADGLVLFSTSSRLLRTDGDEVNGLSARSLFARGSLVGDLSLLRRVNRVPPGSVLLFTASGVEQRPWFDYSGLPPGDEPITDDTLPTAEETFQQAIERCLALLPGGPIDLPLSSGDDSRRILAALHSRGTPLRAVTARVFQKEGRDLDARFAAEMAAALKFDHEVIELPDGHAYGQDDAAARVLMNAEVSEHTWFLGVARALGGRRSLVFDGLAGDIVGNTGYGVRELHVMPEEQKLSRIAMLALGDDGDQLLKQGVWAPLADARAYLVDFLQRVPPSTNRADVAFMLIRARRGTGACAQQLLQAGQIAVYPYLDLDHVDATLNLSSIDKLTQTVQARCLERFWPDYYRFGGSRRIPADAIPVGSAPTDRLIDARLQQLFRETGLALPKLLLRRLESRPALLGLTARVSRRLRLRVGWWLDPTLVLAAFESNDQPTWSRG